MVVRRESGRQQLIVAHTTDQGLTRNSEQCWQRVAGPNRASRKHPHSVTLSLGEVLIQLVDYH